MDGSGNLPRAAVGALLPPATEGSPSRLARIGALIEPASTGSGAAVTFGLGLRKPDPASFQFLPIPTTGFSGLWTGGCVQLLFSALACLV